MGIYTTEITSDKIPSDNPVHQRLLSAYYLVQNRVKGSVLEVGCGEGRGTELLLEAADSYTAIDKIKEVIDRLQNKYPQARFVQDHIPPFHDLPDNTYDYVVSFQVIEHIKKDDQFISEIHRVLKPGGVAYLTTPNRTMSLSRNPWHIREYRPEQLKELSLRYFNDVEIKGVKGNEKVMAYYEQNKESVNRIMRFDILNMQYWLPAWLLKIPYEMLNRINRNTLQKGDNRLVRSITYTDYSLSDDASSSLDLFAILTK